MLISGFLRNFGIERLKVIYSSHLLSTGVKLLCANSKFYRGPKFCYHFPVEGLLTVESY